MNIVNTIELMRLGLGYSNRTDRVYSSLKCSYVDVRKKFDIHANCDLDSNCPVFTCRFCVTDGYHHILAASNEDGKLAIHNTKTKTKSAVTTFQAHNNAIFDITWTNNNRILTASGDHTCLLWDINNSCARLLCQFSGHLKSVKVIATKHDDNSVFATGGRDGLIKLWDTRTNSTNCTSCHSVCVLEPDKTIKFPHYLGTSRSTRKRRRTMQCHEDSGRESITGLTFQNEYTLVSCSADDGLIKFWDTRKSYLAPFRKPQPITSIKHPSNASRNGFLNLMMSPCHTKLYANCMDHSLYCFNVGASDPKLIKVFKGHWVSSFYIKNAVSPDGEYVASGSSDSMAYIWSIHNPEKPIVKLSGHSAEVSCVDWCKKGEVKIVTCSDDASYRIWRVNNEVTNEESSNIGTALCIDEDQKENKTRKVYYQSHIQRARTNKLRSIENSDLVTVLGRFSSNSSDFVNKDTSPIKGLTSDLPDFVFDGRSPHNHQCDRTNSQQVDWLTEFKRKTPQPPLPKFATRKKSSNSSAKTSLLKYFKKASRQLVHCENGEEPFPLSESNVGLT